MEYSEYLQSRRWKVLKQRTYAKYKVCQRCGATKDLDVHHLTYKHIFHETEKDLLLLCRRCHYAWHNRKLGWTHVRPSDLIHYIWIWVVRNYSTPYKRS